MMIFILLQWFEIVFADNYQTDIVVQVFHSGSSLNITIICMDALDMCDCKRPVYKPSLKKWELGIFCFNRYACERFNHTGSCLSHCESLTFSRVLYTVQPADLIFQSYFKYYWLVYWG